MYTPPPASQKNDSECIFNDTSVTVYQTQEPHAAQTATDILRTALINIFKSLRNRPPH